MSFGNGGSTVDTGEGFDWAGNIEKYSQGYNSNDMANALSKMSGDNNGYILTADDIASSDGNRTNIGQIINTLGRLGAGIMGGVGSYESSQQPAYMLKTNWLGNGLAATGLLNNSENKQQQTGNAYGNALMLASLFGHGFGRNNDTIDPIPGKRSSIWD